MSDLLRIGQTRVYHEPLPPAGPAFLLFLAAADGGALPDSIPAAQAWTDPAYTGTFVVLPAAPDGPLDPLAAAVEQSGLFPAPARTGLAWTSYDGQTVEPPQTFALRPRGDAIAIDGDQTVGFGRYGVLLQDGSPVLLVTGGAEVTELRLSYARQEGWPAPNGLGPRLPLDGPDRFCLLTEGLIGDPSDTPGTGFDISLRYCVPGVPEGKKGLRSVRYPLLEPFTGGLHLLAELTLDPLTRWWTTQSAWASRTVYAWPGPVFALTQPDGVWTIGPDPGPPGLASGLRTASGQTVRLLAHDSRFVPQPLSAADGWYLAPAGSFRIEVPVPRPGAPARLLCGLTATEVIQVTPGDLLTFVPGSPAHAPVFPLVPPPSGQPLLDGGAVTAWATVTPAQSSEPPPAYYAQPRTAALFGAAAGGAAPPTGILPLFDPLVAVLDGPPGAAPFPLVPHGAVDDPAFAFAQFEQQILGPSRRAVLGGPSRARDRALRDAAAVPTATPQGFLVAVAGTAWTDLKLARNSRSDGTVDALTVDAVSDDLRTALQSSDLFLVATLAAPFSSFQPTISIADWPFKIDLGTTDGQGYRNVLIFKFGAGKLADKAADPTTWTDAATFNQNPADVSAWLLRYFDAATSAAQDDPRFKTFAGLLTEDAWNGILALRVDVPLDGLPDDLRGLAAGLDPEQFVAHHVGINASKVEQQPDGTFRMPPASSLFGLIDYVDQDTPSNVARREQRMLASATGAGDPGFAFRVLELIAQFESSQIVSFESQIVLTITRLFGEPAALQLDSSASPVQQSAILLDGSLERRVANDGTTVTVYVFSSDDTSRFLMQSQVLHYVEITKADFSTLKPQQPHDPNVQSQFRLWGLLNFQIISSLDLFSFGDPAGTDASSAPAGLAYSNLVIEMDFDIEQPQSTLAFYFTPGGTAFDLASSSVRQPSLATGLPLSLGTIDSSASGTPQAAGYLPVLAADLHGLDPLDTGKWYGITNTLSLGTLGALASLASFNASLVAAWSPGGKVPKVGLLIRLPGTAPGKKELGFQSVLKLSLDQIALESQAGPPPSLTLRFINIALSFLGVKIPSGAVIDAALSGGSQAGATSGGLGWYAFYSAQQPGTEGA